MSTGPRIEPPSHLAEMSRTAGMDSKRWFPDKVKSDTYLIHLVLGLCGEAGELANLLKKLDRGDLNLNNAKARMEMGFEGADVFTYLLCIFDELGLDLEKVYYAKRRANEQRFNGADRSNGA